MLASVFRRRRASPDARSARAHSASARLTIHKHALMNLSMHAAAETLLFKPLAGPTRRALFERLAREGELTVGALTRRAGVSQPAVSQHLEALRQGGVGKQPRGGPPGHYPALPRRAGVSQPAVSQHLEALRQAGLVKNRRDGRTAHYRATPRGLAPLTNWLAPYGVFWRERFDRLEKLLKEMDQ